MLQSVCHIKWWNATSSKAPKSVGAEDFCCGDPFWHQTIHQYRSTGVCSLQRCTLGFDRSLREPKLVALFRDPVDRFISGVYYFARWEARAKLFSTPPKNFSLAEFDRLAHLSLQVRMKAPVQEYAVILSRHARDFKWGQVAPKETVDRAKKNLESDLDGRVKWQVEWGGFPYP
mmetsp:Transcript_54513/g.124200  ORF Transcript_54513/g.124200 Transcript_54513/m.124200 type:complete len:174 (+) Transcript_54513:244-765(+)